MFVRNGEERGISGPHIRAGRGTGLFHRQHLDFRIQQKGPIQEFRPTRPASFWDPVSKKNLPEFDRLAREMVALLKEIRAAASDAAAAQRPNHGYAPEPIPGDIKQRASAAAIIDNGSSKSQRKYVGHTQYDQGYDHNAEQCRLNVAGQSNQESFREFGRDESPKEKSAESKER